MAKPILLATRRLPATVEARAARDYDARLNAEDKHLTGAELVRSAQAARAIIVSPTDRIDPETIAALPDSVRAIATFSVGCDHVAVDAARARGIAIINTPDVLSVTTAETVVLLILAAARRAGEAERLVRSGKMGGLGADPSFSGRKSRGVGSGSSGWGGSGARSRDGARLRHGSALPRPDEAAVGSGTRRNLR